jgi:hypothetical protein
VRHDGAIVDPLTSRAAGEVLRESATVTGRRFGLDLK